MRLQAWVPRSAAAPDPGPGVQSAGTSTVDLLPLQQGITHEPPCVALGHMVPGSHLWTTLSPFTTWDGDGEVVAHAQDHAPSVPLQLAPRCLCGSVTGLHVQRLQGLC